MSEVQQVGKDADTEVIPGLGGGEAVPRTRELPVVQDETEIVAAEPTPAPPPRPEPVVVQPLPKPVAMPPRPEPVPAQPRSEVVAAPPATPAGRRPLRPGILVALVVALVVAVGAGVVVVRGRSGGGAAAAAPGRSASAAPVAATITSVDPSGGSGFRLQGAKTWRTQTYASADFGNLKPGVGLLLDLGAPRDVAEVTFEVVGGPASVELRAGDQAAASERSYAVTARSDSASGPTRLAAENGGKHRYWLVWVTRLPAADGGYRAVIRNPVAAVR